MNLVQRLLEHPNPLRFAVSRTLRLTGLCRFQKIERNGYWIHFHPTALATTLWEDPAARLQDEKVLEYALRRGSIFVDVGANIGTLSLKAASLVGPEGRIVAIEGHPGIFKYLCQNVELNSFKNIKCYCGAVGASNGVAGISDKYSDDQNQITDKPAGRAVKIRPLDEVLRSMKVSSIRLLKIDVEGFEAQVLKGGQFAIEVAEAIYIEVNPLALAKFGSSFDEIKSLLPDFKFFEFQQNGTLTALPADHRPSGCRDILAIRPTSPLFPGN